MSNISLSFSSFESKVRTRRNLSSFFVGSSWIHFRNSVVTFRINFLLTSLENRIRYYVCRDDVWLESVDMYLDRWCSVLKVWICILTGGVVSWNANMCLESIAICLNRIRNKDRFRDDMYLEQVNTCLEMLGLCLDYLHVSWKCQCMSWLSTCFLKMPICVLRIHVYVYLDV